MESNLSFGQYGMNAQFSDERRLLFWKKLLLIPAAWILCVILPNAVDRLVRSFFEPDGDERFFLLRAVVVIPLDAITCLSCFLVRLLLRIVGKR